MTILPADNSYQTFCELTSGYRSYRVMSAAVRLGVIDWVAAESCLPAELAEGCGLRAEEGRRFIELLVTAGLLEQHDGRLFLSRFAATWLDSASPSSQRQVLEFEELLMENWNQLETVLTKGQGALLGEQPPQEYQRRLALYQQAMGEAALVRSRELWAALPELPASGLIIDIGAGDGSYLKLFLEQHPGWQAIACDLGDVCARAQAQPAVPNLRWYPLNILDPAAVATLVAAQHNCASLVLLSNLIHCYSLAENRALLAQLKALPGADGILVIHDFFRDGNSFGALYDLHMLVNTYNGRSFSLAETADLLEEAGFGEQSVLELPSHSHALVAGRTGTRTRAEKALYPLRAQARQLGFHAAVELEPGVISSKPWVRAKCAYGCAAYGRKWSCPPNSMGAGEFHELLACYGRALLLVGQPPLKMFQEQLLAMEKAAFLQGFTKALVFSGGPCCWCDVCPDERCAHPEKRRPSLEACGCDVFALAKTAGIDLVPLRHSDDFVQYVGLLLLD